MRPEKPHCLHRYKIPVIAGVIVFAFVISFVLFGDDRSYLVGLSSLGLAVAAMSLCVISGAAVADRRGMAWGAAIGVLVTPVACASWTYARLHVNSTRFSLADETQSFLILSLFPFLIMLWMIFRTARHPKSRLQLKGTARRSICLLACLPPILLVSPVVKQMRVQDFIPVCQMTAVVIVLLGTLPWILLDRRLVYDSRWLPTGKLDGIAKDVLIAIAVVDILCVTASLIFCGFIIPTKSLLLPVHLIVIVLFFVVLTIQAGRNHWHRWLSIIVGALLYATSLWWFWGLDL